MSATRVDPPTEELPAFVRIMPGPLGLDSPYVPERSDQVPLTRWHAWFDLVADRAAARTSPRHVVEDALGKRIDELWGLWWLTYHVEQDRQLLHRARLMIVAGGGEMLLSACRLSLPWTGPSDNVVPRAEAPEVPGQVTMCTVCAENDPADPATRAVEHVWRGRRP